MSLVHKLILNFKWLIKVYKGLGWEATRKNSPSRLFLDLKGDKCTG